LRPQVAVLSLVTNPKKVLMIRRADPPHTGKWTLPGGHLEFGESLEDTAVRETKEETGVSIRVIGFVGFKNALINERSGKYHVVLFCYRGVAEGGSLEKGPEVADVAWKNPREMARNSIAAPILGFLGSRAPPTRAYNTTAESVEEVRDALPAR
jgi:ADP-ribose pyrophosphatase YjhB (NUDIX family)